MRHILVILLVFISSTLFSQARLDQPEIYIGTSHGAIGSMVMFKPSVSQSYLLGYNGGLIFRYISEKNVGMQAELNYSQRGWSESDSNYERQLNYIELPFLTHIYFGNKTRFFFNIGPKVSYLISEKVLVDNTLNSVITSYSIHYTKLYDHPFRKAIY